MDDKNQKFIQEKYLADLNQTRNTGYLSRAPQTDTSTEEGPRGETPASAQKTSEELPAEEQYADELAQSRNEDIKLPPPPKKQETSFPWFALIVCLVNDLLDVIAFVVDWLGVSIPVVTGIQWLIDWITLGIRSLGRVYKPSSLFLTWLLEAIPFLNILPFCTGFVIYDYFSETQRAEDDYRKAKESYYLETAMIQQQTKEEIVIK